MVWFLVKKGTVLYCEKCEQFNEVCQADHLLNRKYFNDKLYEYICFSCGYSFTEEDLVGSSVSRKLYPTLDLLVDTNVGFDLNKDDLN